MEFLSGLDLATVSFGLLMVLGAVNGLDILAKKYLHRGLASHEKFILSIVVAFGISFIPADLQNQILERMVEAIKLALIASGGYKVSQKLGGQ